MSDKSVDKVWWCELTRIKSDGSIHGALPGSAIWDYCFRERGRLADHEHCGWRILVETTEDFPYQYEAKVEWFDDRPSPIVGYESQWKTMGLPGLKESYFGDTPKEALEALIDALHNGTSGTPGSALKAIHYFVSRGNKIRIVRRRSSIWFEMKTHTERVLKDAYDLFGDPVPEPVIEPVIELLP